VNSFILPLELKSEDGVQLIKSLQNQQTVVMEELGALQQRAAGVE
jgi:hypothetical protein